MKSFLEWKEAHLAGHSPFDAEKYKQEEDARHKWLVNGVVKKELVPQIDHMIDKFIATPQSSPWGLLDAEGEHSVDKAEVYAALIEGMKIRLEDFRFYHR